MKTVTTLNYKLKTAYINAVTRIQASSKFVAMYQQFVVELTEKANSGSATPVALHVGYDLLHAMVVKLREDGLCVKYWNDTVEAQIKFE